MKGGIVYLSVEGFLDAHTFEMMDAEIQDQFEQGNYRVIIDLEKVEYISSAGAGVFIGNLSVAQENEGEIILIKPNDNVKEVFDLLGITLMFKICYDLREAVSAFPA
ncbi:MAG: STAS domain-containing protein [Planctomycetes bacterium]|nr:STAS domain-containing protein [Planctomycetota bacterium]